jgi:predicted HAD superfamily Cof-like phosphohydrolase
MTTTQSGFQDVQDFHDKFGVPMATIPSLLGTEAYNFRIRFLQEEYTEYLQAQHDNDLPLAFDSLIDLVYVAYGTAQMMGCTPAMWQEMWDAVQVANMSKVRATAAADSKRGTALDVIKPAGWTSPDAKHNEIIARYTALATTNLAIIANKLAE